MSSPFDFVLSHVFRAALRDTSYSGDSSIEPFIYKPDGPGCAARGINYIRSLETRS